MCHNAIILYSIIQFIVGKGFTGSDLIEHTGTGGMRRTILEQSHILLQFISWNCGNDRIWD